VNRRRYAVLPVILAAGVIAALAATGALAHRATIEISAGDVEGNCGLVTWNFTSFPDEGTNSAHGSVAVDSAVVFVDTFEWEGASATFTHELGLSGSHTVAATADWTVDGGGQASAEAEVDCGEEAPPPTTTEEQPPPPTTTEETPPPPKQEKCKPDEAMFNGKCYPAVETPANPAPVLSGEEG
jgi:hypothetical protein